MRCNKFPTIRVATALALSLCVNVISYAGTDTARLVTTMVKLSKKLPQEVMILQNDVPKNGGTSGIKSSSGK